MKKPGLYLILLFISLVACKKTKELLDIPFDYTLNNDFTLPKFTDQEVDLPDSTVTINTGNITNTAPDEFKKNHANIDMIKSLSVKSFTLTIKNPPGQTFGFMKSIKVYFGAQGVGETLIASKNDINTITPPPTTLTLTAENPDIAKYIKGPTYYLKVETVLDKSYTQDIIIGSTITLHAVANPLN